MTAAASPAASTCGTVRRSVGFIQSDTKMLVGQTAIQVSNAIFQRGGTLAFFDEKPPEFIPSPFSDLIADQAAKILHTFRLSPGRRIDTFAHFLPFYSSTVVAVLC